MEQNSKDNQEYLLHGSRDYMQQHGSSLRVGQEQSWSRSGVCSNYVNQLRSRLGVDAPVVAWEQIFQHWWPGVDLEQFQLFKLAEEQTGSRFSRSRLGVDSSALVGVDLEQFQLFKLALGVDWEQILLEQIRGRWFRSSLLNSIKIKRKFKWPAGQNGRCINTILNPSHKRGLGIVPPHVS